jgi:hypothetical protein
MELEGSLPYSQEPATVPYPETDESYRHSPTVRSILILWLIDPLLRKDLEETNIEYSRCCAVGE